MGATDANVLTITAPASGEELGRVPVLGRGAVDALVARARAAQPEWHDSGLHERVRLVRRFRKVLLAHARDVALLSSRETGKLPIEALLTDVQTTAELARWYTRRAEHVLGRTRAPAGWLITKRCYTVREPYGVVGVIGPWNFPVLNTMRAVLAALVAGNTVVLKPSEYSPLTALRMRELASEAGWPDDVFVIATGARDTGAALVAAAIDKLVFTGSVETGRQLARAAAERLLPLSLELGGKDPLLVLQGADLERAADAAIAGAFLNAGQICTSVERAYVEATVYDEFVHIVEQKARGVRTGPPEDPQTDVGAITTQAQLRVIEQQVDDAVRAGARVLLGGRSVPGTGRFYEPTVLVDVTHDMRIMREETFGPVLPIMKVRDAREAVALANDSKFALAASIWGEDAERLALQLRAGTVNVNDTLLSGMVAALPFGGPGDSGGGRMYGDEGLREVSWVRSVLVDRTGLRELAYPLRRYGAERVFALLDVLHGQGLRARLRALPRLLRRAAR